MCFMARRASFKDLNLKQTSEGVQNNEDNVSGGIKKQLDFDLKMIHETSDIDEDGERVEYKIGIPYTDADFTQFVESIISTRTGNLESGFYNKVVETIKRGTVKNKSLQDLVKEQTILMGFSIKLNEFSDELVFRVVATDRLIRGAMTRLTKDLETALNKCKTEDELRVKWFLVKRILSGEKVEHQKGSSSYGHGFDLGKKGLGRNSVYGAMYGCMVMISEIDPKQMSMLRMLTEHYRITDIDWSISNYQPANIRVIGNMEFVVKDTRQVKNNFYGVKYDLKLEGSSPRVSQKIRERGNITIEDVLNNRWMVNSLTRLEVILVDFNIESVSVRKRGSIEGRIVVRKFINSNIDKRDQIKIQPIKDIGVFRSINYAGLFAPRTRKESIRKENLELGIPSGGTIPGTERDIEEIISVEAYNISELFQFLYLSNQEFKDNVDSEFKEYKDAGVQVLLDVLESVKEVNLPLMLIMKSELGVNLDKGWS